MILGQIAGNVRRHFIKSFTINDAGKYKCKATDPSGRSDSRSATVRMEGTVIFYYFLRDTPSPSPPTLLHAL
jgi:hypothetical protein